MEVGPLNRIVKSLCNDREIWSARQRGFQMAQDEAVLVANFGVLAITMTGSNLHGLPLQRL